MSDFRESDDIEVNGMDDLELLRQYSREGSQTAFSVLVARYVDLVYSAARRQVRSAELAEEVTQAVFLDLAQHAEKLRPDSHLSSWLYVVARRTSVDAIRRESRRQKREHTAVEGAALSSSGSLWAKVEPLLDEAVSSLNETDRRAILLRFFEEKSFSEIGRSLGASEEAAQKRVSRAVDRLREFLYRRGVATTAVALAAEISPRIVLGAPAGLASSVAGAIALSHPAFSPAAIHTSAHTLTMTFAQKAASSAILAVALVAGFYANGIIRSQARQIVFLEGQMELERQQAGQLDRERTAIAGQIAALRKADARLSDANPGEESNDPTDVALRSWLTRVSQLRHRLDEQPDQKIPELQFANGQDWLNAAKANLNDEDDYRRALAGLRTSAEQRFQPNLLAALKKYLKDSAGTFPTDPSQLAPYFDSPVDPAVLQRYAVIPTNSDLMDGKKPGTGFVVTRNPVDPKYDYSLVLSARGNGSMGPQGPNTLRSLLDAFFAAKTGQTLTSYDELAPYATTPAEQAALQRAQQFPDAK